MVYVATKYNDQNYNDDTTLLDGLYEFHPDFFDDLTADEQTRLRRYFLVGRPVPQDVFQYRQDLNRIDPELEAKALQALEKLLRSAGIDRQT